jgi:hypothetical protein
MNNTLSASDKLLLEYDNIFNETNKIYNDNDKELNLKTKLLTVYHEDNLKKKNLISILQYSFTFILLSFFIILIYMNNLISLALTVILILFILGALVFKFLTIKTDNIDLKINQKSVNTGNELKKTFEEAYLNLVGINNYSCQQYCNNDTDNTDNTDDNDVDINDSQVKATENPKYLKQDSQRNVWLKGDLPDNTYTINDNKHYRIDGELVKGYGYDKNLYKSPKNIKQFRKTKDQLENNKPATRTIIPISEKYATYYNCDFVTNKDKNDKLPYKSSYKYTTIPCDNYPGFVETSKMICPNNPSTHGENGCKII